MAWNSDWDGIRQLARLAAMVLRLVQPDFKMLYLSQNKLVGYPKMTQGVRVISRGVQAGKLNFERC